MGFAIFLLLFCCFALGFGLALRYFPDRAAVPASPDVGRLAAEIRDGGLFGAGVCDDPGIAAAAARFGFRVVDRDGTILKLRRDAWTKFKSLSIGGRALGVAIFPLSVCFAAGLMIGLWQRRGFDELIHLDAAAPEPGDF